MGFPDDHKGLLFMPSLRVGNENAAILTAVVPYILRVDLTDWEDNTAYAEYTNFVLGGAATNYTILSLGAYSGTAGMLYVWLDSVGTTLMLNGDY